MSDDESEGAKRASKKRKASRACDRCNVQHQPCDNLSPKCSVCERAGTECTYDRPVRKRGPRTGYTAQHGERLWGLVLQANPAIEDMVLQILASDRSETGASNAEYFRNNDHQTDLVRRFNESRIGRFVQGGELPDPKTFRNAQAALPVGPGHGSGQTNPDQDQSQDVPVRGNGLRSRRGTVSSSAKSSPTVNHLGAPQNPGDIYTLSDDIRKQVFHPGVSTSRSHEASPHTGAHTPDWRSFNSPANNTNNGSAFSFAPNGYAGNYDGGLLHNPGENGPTLGARTPNNRTDLLRTLGQPNLSHGQPIMQQENQHAELHITETNQW
jgi:hypothetical protein